MNTENIENTENTNCPTPEKPEGKTGFWKKVLIKVGLVSATAAVTASTLAMSGCAEPGKQIASPNLYPGTKVEDGQTPGMVYTEKVPENDPYSSQRHEYIIGFTIKDGARLRQTPYVYDSSQTGETNKIADLPGNVEFKTPEGARIEQVNGPGGLKDWYILSRDEIAAVYGIQLPADMEEAYVSDEMVDAELKPDKATETPN
ncbi:MAG: hypothetical protein WCP11_02035 [Candidatus Saccharibacteria bacterium]